MKIAISGASGHIGNNICRLLANETHDIRVLVHSNTDGLHQLPVDIFHGDILNYDDVAGFVDGAEIVFHLAAKITMYKKDKEAQTINIEGTKIVLRALSRNPKVRLIYFSSIDALDQTPLHTPVDENAPLDIGSHYTYNHSKALSEQLVLDACDDGLDAVILSPTAVIGPHDYLPSLAGNALIRFYQGRNPAIVDGGYNWVDVRDVAQAAINAIKAGKKGHKYLLAGHWKSVAEMAQTVAKYGGAQPPAFKSPYWLAHLGVPFMRLAAALRKEMPVYTSFTLDTVRYGNKNIINKKASSDLQFDPRPFEVSIADTLAWFKSQNML